MKKLLILSGKGGTGKTTIAGAFIKLFDARAFADCDVDAPNLHLILKQDTIPEKKDYYGMDKARISADKCIACGLCEQNCRFGAIEADKTRFKINGFSCEGCGICEAVCRYGAIEMYPYIAGGLMLYKNDTVFSTAKLKMGSGTSGKLVYEVKKQLYSNVKNPDCVIIDGSPGIGCPVIASISGVDMVLIVAEPSISGISDMERIIKTARKFGIKITVCINKYDINIENTKIIERLCEEQDIPFAGRIPFDFNVVRSINMGKNIIDIDCEASKAIKKVFENTQKIL